MLLALLIVLLQFEKTWTYNKITIGNKTLFTRGLEQLTWLAAREACGNKSSVILPSMRDTRALELLHVGEFAWIDGKQYSFCQKKNDTEICRHATVRRENSRENLTYICIQDTGYKIKDDTLSYADAIKQCLESKSSLLVVNSFNLPMVVPLNKVCWIENISESSINSSLATGQLVTSICIGVIKLDHDKFEFVSTPCDENHTFICDASGTKTALTLTTKEETMPSLGDIKARISSRDLPKLYLIYLGPICGGLIVVIAIIVIVLYRKRKLNQNLSYLHKNRPKGCAVQSRHYGEMLPCDNFMDLRTESERRLFPCTNFNVKYSTQGQNNNSGNIATDLDYHTNESSFMSSQNSPDDSNFSHYHNLQEYAILAEQAALCGQSISSGNQKCVFSTREGTIVSKKRAVTGFEKERNDMYTDKEENFRMADTTSEYQVTILVSN